MSTPQFSDGCDLSASTAALAKYGMNDSLTPSRARKSALAASRWRAIEVTSTSTTVVSWAAVCSDSTIRVAITLRSRDIFSVLPRSGLGAGTPVDWPAGSAAGASAQRRCGSARGLASSAAASMTSCLRIRPPTPVPVTEARSTSCWAASLRTSGVT